MKAVNSKRRPRLMRPLIDLFNRRAFLSLIHPFHDILRRHHEDSRTPARGTDNGTVNAKPRRFHIKQIKERRTRIAVERVLELSKIQALFSLGFCLESKNEQKNTNLRFWKLYMAFFTSAIDTLKVLVIALGAGLGVWGVINLLEGYGNDNPGAKSQG